MQRIDDDSEALKQEAKRLLGPLQFAECNKREVWRAFLANPAGVERCALLASAKGKRQGMSSAGLLLTMLRAGEHLLEADPSVELPTGWRWVRGIDGQSGTYLHDPAGIDPLPAGYQ